MRKTLLVLWALLIAVGLGFYLGRVTAKSPQAKEVPPAGETSAVVSSTPPPAQPAPAAERTQEEPQQTRSRTSDTGPVEARRLGVPIRGIDPSTIRDSFYDKRGGGSRTHGATDIMADRGTPVLAVDDGVIKKLFLSEAGGNTIYQFDPSEQYCYYYAHLDRYAAGIQEGMTVRRGQVIGYVGSTGDADANAPHLHFEIHELGPGKEWWKGTALDPYPILMRAYGQ